MIEPFSLPSTVRDRLRSLSMGVKLVIVCLLALFMTIPALFVSDLVRERTQRASDVVRDISKLVGGQQTFLGPTLAIPYNVPPQSNQEATRRGIYLVFPTLAAANITTTTEERHRSLFRVPVFQANLKLDATFDLTGAPNAAPPNAQLDWSRAEIIVGASDARGALADAALSLNGQTLLLAPSGLAPDLFIGENQRDKLRLILLGIRSVPAIAPDQKFSVSASLRFSGAQRIALLAYGKTTTLSMHGDWLNPSFDGGFLPATRSISDTGFNAQWSVPFIARGIRAEGPIESMRALDTTALGVSFVELADPYQSVSRSLKYVLLFLGLIFLSYFVFEVTTSKRVHPAQYVLVGIAQIIFYLLLLSFAERIGFDWAFLLAGSATVLLLSTNAGWVFASRAQGLRALVVFTLLYVLIYLLLRLEDNALLIGAIASFLAVATAMYFTRRIDWYRPLSPPTDQPRHADV
jgi:inner membrane protein